jgi:Kef-type K+ transport system membrane component KefB
LLLTAAVNAFAASLVSAAPAEEPLPRELEYVALLFALFIVPRILIRYRIPTAITSLALGAVAGVGYGLFQSDTTIQLLAGLGIVALFLFAGLDVSFEELRRERGVVVEHLVILVLTLALVTWAAWGWLGLPLRPAILVALALLTPSTGFILESLHALPVNDRERFWIKSKAVAAEVLALAVLFFTLQSATLGRLGISLLVLAGLVAVLPLLFRLFAIWIAPYAPKSEFSFLVILAVFAAMITLRLGVYYLVGAFVVGLVAQRFRERLPALASERMLHSVEVFATFFIPFYFFSAGLHLRRGDFSLGALVLGIAFLCLVLPFRLLVVGLHRRFSLREPLARGARVAVSMLPTLVFTLVIAGILRDRFDVDPMIFGGLIVYTLANTLVPGFALRTSLPDFGPFTDEMPAYVPRATAELVAGTDEWPLSSVPRHSSHE